MRLTSGVGNSSSYRSWEHLTAQGTFWNLLKALSLGSVQMQPCLLTFPSSCPSGTLRWRPRVMVCLMSLVCFSYVCQRKSSEAQEGRLYLRPGRWIQRCCGGEKSRPSSAHSIEDLYPGIVSRSCRENNNRREQKLEGCSQTILTGFSEGD